MYCPFCGFELPDDALFCPNCGRRMPSYDKKILKDSEEEIDTDLSYSGEIPQKTIPYPPAYTHMSQLAYNKKKEGPDSIGKAFLIISAICGILILIAIFYPAPLEGSGTVTPTPSFVDNKISVLIASDPTGASVYMSGDYKGTTPLTLKLAPNTNYMVVLKKAGYDQWTKSVKVGSSSMTITADLVNGGTYYNTVTPVPTTRQNTAQTSDAKNAKAISAAIEPSNSYVRSYALSAIKSSNGGSYNIGQICDIYDKLYSDWVYVNDPAGTEYYAKASESVRLLRGDCDDYAILMASLIESIGGGARVIFAYDGSGGGHAYAEVYMSDSKTDVQGLIDDIGQRYGGGSVSYHTGYDKNNNPEYWLNLDWTSNHPGGKFYENQGTILMIRSNGYYVRVRD